MSNEMIVDLMERLLASTETGKASWSAESTTSFILALPSGSVRVWSVDGDGVAPFAVSLYDEDGVEIESMRTWRTIDGPPPWHDVIQALYEAARTNAFNIGGVVAGILADLEKAPEERGPPAQLPGPIQTRDPHPDDDIPF